MEDLPQLGLGVVWKVCHNSVWYGRSVTTRSGMEGLSQIGLGLEWKVCHH